MLSSNFKKLTVYGAGMKKVGKVKDLDIDPTSFAVTHLIVEVEGRVAKQIGIKPLIGRSTARLAVSIIDKIADAAILKLSIEELKGYLHKK